MNFPFLIADATLKVNKAVHTAALVADGWAGAENSEKRLCDRRTYGCTDGPTDRKVAYRVACLRIDAPIDERAD